MADRYWVGGTGTWDATTTTNWSATSNGPGGASAPTSVDDVFFDVNSNVGTGAFTVTVTGTSAAPANCRDFTASGLDGALTFTMGATAFLDVYGSMTLPASNFSVSGTAGANIRYRSTSTGKTLTTNGVSLGNVAIVFDGVGGGWTLGSAYTSTQLITLTNGAVDTGNFNVTATGVSSSNSNIRSFTLGSSTFTLSGATPVTFTTSTNFTINANTSTIICSATSPTFAGGGLTFFNVSFTSTATGTNTITGANIFNNLLITSLAATGIRNISISANQTVNGTLTLGAANTAIRRLFVRSNDIGTPRTITAATVATLADVDFRDIVGAGTGTWSGTRLGNCGGNSSITFVAGKLVYRVGTGNWSATQWALSSGGGVDVNNLPLAQDTAIFDTGTTTGTHTVDVAWNIGSLNMSALNVAVTLNFGGSASSFYGDVTLNANVTFNGAVNLSFSGATTQTLTSAGVTIAPPIYINAPSTAGVILNGNLSILANGITLEKGTLNLNNNTLTCLLLLSSYTTTRSIVFGTGKIVLTGNNTTIVAAANLNGFSITGTPRIESSYSGSTGTRTFDVGRAGGVTESNVLDIYITAGSDIVDLRNIGGQFFKSLIFTGFTGSTSINQQLNIYGDLTYSAGMTVSAGTSMSFLKSSGTQTVTTNGKTVDFPITKSAAGTLQFADSLTMGSTRTFTFSNGTVQLKNGATSVVGTFVTSGTTQKVLQSTLLGSQATLSQTTGTVNAQYLTIQDINAIGGATWNAFVDQQNIDAGNNDGWDFGISPVVAGTEYTYSIRSFTQPRRF